MQKSSSVGKFHFEPPFTSFDYLVGGKQKVRRNRQAERLGGIKVDNQLVLGRLLEGQIASFLPTQDAIITGFCYVGPQGAARAGRRRRTALRTVPCHTAGLRYRHPGLESPRSE